MEAILAMHDISMIYPNGTQALKDVNLTIYEGEFIAIIGPSGSGKSTIFRLVNQLISAQAGKIIIDGRDIATEKYHCGYMPQQDLLFPWRSVAENLRLPLEIQKNNSKAEMNQKVTDALVAVGLADYGNKAPTALSGGMRQRAAFARTMLTGSNLLLLDEPFSALDYLTRLSMREWLLEQWQAERKTVLFITHDVEEAMFLASRILVVEENPITTLKSVAVPLAYPRTPQSLEQPAMLDLKNQLITMLRREKA